MFLYSNNKHNEKEIMVTLSFTIASKTIKYLEINKIKEVKKLYNESLIYLKKEVDRYT